jgi:hypothetical protein
MKNRILTYEQYKRVHENYSIEDQTEKADSVLDNQEDTLDADSANELPFGEEEDASTIENGNDEEEVSLDETDTEEELDENKELKEKILTIIDANYKESLKDIFDGIINELEDDIDIENALDAISDVFSKKLEEFANGDGEEDEESEEGAEPSETEEGNAEAATEPVEGAESTEGAESATPEEGENEETIEL